MDTRSSRLIRDACWEVISAAMTPTCRSVVTPAANAAAVEGNSGSNRAPSSAVRGPTCWATRTCWRAMSWSQPSRSLNPPVVVL